MATRFEAYNPKDKRTAEAYNQAVSQLSPEQKITFEDCVKINVAKAMEYLQSLHEPELRKAEKRLR